MSSSSGSEDETTAREVTQSLESFENDCLPNRARDHARTGVLRLSSDGTYEESTVVLPADRLSVMGSRTRTLSRLRDWADSVWSGRRALISDLIYHLLPGRAALLVPFVCGPAADLRKKIVVVLGGFRKPNAETGGQRMQVHRRGRPRIDYFSAQDDRRGAAARAQMNDDDGADGRWSGRSHEDAAARKVASNPGRSSLLDLEADRDIRRAATRRSLLLPGSLRDQGC